MAAPLPSCRIAELATALREHLARGDEAFLLAQARGRVRLRDFQYAFGVPPFVVSFLWQLLADFEQRCCNGATAMVAWHLLALLRHLRHGYPHRDAAIWWEIAKETHVRVVNAAAERLFAAVSEVRAIVVGTCPCFLSCALFSRLRCVPPLRYHRSIDTLSAVCAVRCNFVCSFALPAVSFLSFLFFLFFFFVFPALSHTPVARPPCVCRIHSGASPIGITYHEAWAFSTA
jgi:hypothetical protein